MMIKIQDLFDIHTGIERSKICTSPVKLDDNHIIYIRPSNEYQNTFNGYVDKNLVGVDKIYPSETIFYGNTGEGCHTFAYISQSEFVPNNNVSVLISKIPLTLAEKLFYANV